MVKKRSYFSLVLALLLSLVLASAALAHPIVTGSTYSADQTIGMFQDNGDADGTDDGTDDVDTSADDADDAGVVDDTSTDTTTDDATGAPAVTDPQQGVQDTQQGTQQQAPGTLPQTGGETTPWAMLLLIAVGGLVLISGLGLAFSRRPH
jgi:hypothetical protein